jgi:uncharacterized membrane protein
MIDEKRPPISPRKARQAAGKAFAYLRDIDHSGNVFFVLLGGFAAALWIWERSNRVPLQDYILTNQIAGEARPSLLLLALGALAALLIWLGAGLARGQRRRTDFAEWLDRTSGAALALALLPFLPVLMVDGIEAVRPWLTMGCVALMGLIAGAAAHTARWPTQDAMLAHRTHGGRGPEVGLVIVGGLSAFYLLYMSALTIARHNAFMTHSFDLGIYDQVLHTLLREGALRSTQHGAAAINHLSNHFSPILYLVAPVYALWQDARMLLLLQSLALGIGAIPVYLLARRITGSARLALALGCVYLLYPALHGVNTFDFHQIILATPLLLFSLWFLESGRDRAFVVTLLLALLVKEELGLTVAAIGGYVFVGKRRYRLGAALAVIGMGYFLIVTKAVMPALGGAPQVNRFAAMMASGEDGLEAIARTLLTNPFYTLTLIFSNPDRLIYLSQIFLPLLFTPFFGGIAWLAALPAISVSLLTDAETQFSIAYHYSAIFIPFAFYLAACGLRFLLSLRRIGPEGEARLAPAEGLTAALVVAGLAMNFSYGWIFSKQFYELSLRTQHAATVRQCIAGIPPQASVSAMSDLVPHLSGRSDIYLFPIVNGADFIVFDADPAANFWPFIERDGRLDAIRGLAPHVVSGEYGLVRSQDGCLILQRGADPGANGEAVRVLLSARYEAESLSSQFPDSAVVDGTASEGRARRAASETPHPDAQNALTFGPYDTLFTGKYRAEFFLKYEGTAGGGPAATVDIFSNAAGGALAGQDVLPEEIAASGGYTPVPVDVEIGQPWADLEYRVLFHGPGALSVDRVTLSPVTADFLVARGEAETATATGEVAFSTVEDAQASGGKARAAEPSPLGEVSRPMPAGTIAETRVGDLLPGGYRADFTLKATPGGATGPIATLEVLSEGGGNIVAARTLSAADFTSPGAYQDFSVEFGSDRLLSDVALRIRYDGGAAVWADAMELVYRYREPARNAPQGGHGRQRSSQRISRVCDSGMRSRPSGAARRAPVTGLYSPTARL